MHINDKEYDFIWKYIEECSTVKDEYNKAPDKFIKEHPATTENIRKYLEENGKSLLSIEKDDIGKIIDDYNSYIWSLGNCEHAKYVKENWNDVEKIKPEPYMWCVGYTNFHVTRVCFYNDKENKWTDNAYFDTSKKSTKMAGPDYENVLYWTYIEFDKPSGKVVNGISYVDFPEHRFKEDGTVELMPGDICKFRMKKADDNAHYPFPVHHMKYSMFCHYGAHCGYYMDNVVEIIMVTPDIEDGISDELKRKKINDKLEMLDDYINKTNKSEAKAAHAINESLLTSYDYMREDVMKHYDDIVSYIDEQCKNRKMTERERHDFIDLLETVAFKRRCGKTRKIMNKLIDDFFDLPMYTAITVRDHCDNENMTYFLEELKRQLRLFNIKYTLGKELLTDGTNGWVLRRTENTSYEKACDEFLEICAKHNIL